MSNDYRNSDKNDIKKQVHLCIFKLSITPWSNIFAYQIPKINAFCNTEPGSPG